MIIHLFLETLNRLSLAANAFYDFYVSPGDLWQKNDAILTDAAKKMLRIENWIVSKLNSQCKPMHLLCKSHTVEALDRSNLDVLAKIEKQVNQRRTLENINPSLKSFFSDIGKQLLLKVELNLY